MSALTRAFVLALALVSGCKEKGIGLPCITTELFCNKATDCPTGFRCEPSTGLCLTEDNETSISVNAIECPSSICISMPTGSADGGALPVCSDLCSSDNDCSESDTSTCRRERTAGQYVCVQMEKGQNLSCERACVCDWYAEANGLYAFDGGGHAVPPSSCN